MSKMYKEDKRAMLLLAGMVGAAFLAYMMKLKLKPLPA